MPLRGKARGLPLRAAGGLLPRWGKVPSAAVGHGGGTTATAVRCARRAGETRFLFSAREKKADFIRKEKSGRGHPCTLWEETVGALNRSISACYGYVGQDTAAVVLRSPPRGGSGAPARAPMPPLAACPTLRRLVVGRPLPLRGGVA